jgi:hypothetical protein
MKYLSLALTLVLCACTNSPNVLNAVQITNIQKVCEKNQGLLAVSVNKDTYQALCSNHTKLPSGLTYFAPTVTVLNKEIVACQKVCEKNQGLKEISTRFVCTQTVGFRVSSCVKAENQVKCSCQNQIFADYIHEVPTANNQPVDYSAP